MIERRRSLRSMIERFRKAEGGVAAVEFALILPFLLLLYVGSIEASQLITADRRVTTVAGAIGDLASRVNGTLKKSTMTDYFQAAAGIMRPWTTTDLKQVVTFVEVKANGTTSIKWSVGYGGGKPHTVGTAYALPTEITSIASGSWVMVSEASYDYMPALGIVFQSKIPLYRENFYLPRYGKEIKYDTAS